MMLGASPGQSCDPVSATDSAMKPEPIRAMLAKTESGHQVVRNERAVSQGERRVRPGGQFANCHQLMLSR
jgi:hypothetical protein